MAITESKKQSDLEKRLKILRQQVYGRTDSSEHQSIRASKSSTHRYTDAPIYQHTDIPTSDIIYLRHDLTKILTLSSVVIGIQLVLFVLTRNHILNIKFL